MDVAVRSAFLSSVVPKESRTRFLGIGQSSPCQLCRAVADEVLYDSERLQDARLDSWTDTFRCARQSRSIEMGVRRFGLLEVDLYVRYCFSYHARAC